MTETFTCPLCDTRSYTDVLQLTDRVMRTMDDSFGLVRCSGCGLHRLHPAPDADTLARSYSSDYNPHVRPGLSGTLKGVQERRSVRLLQHYVGNSRRVLDVGCATGDLLAAVRAHGNPNVSGVEPGEEAARIARSRGLNVVTGELESAGFADESFDTVLLSHTLEHVADPVSFLAEVHRLLSPGGIVLIWLPNADSVEAKVFGRFWIGYDAPRHLTTFSVGTLGRALAAARFEIQEVKHETIGLEWAWGMRLIAREYFPNMERFLARAHPLLIVAFSPLAMLSARLRRSGRVRVTARKVT